MGREVKRVPLDFKWPLNKVWAGYNWPEYLSEADCPDCENGMSPEADVMHKQWYSHLGGEFDPASTGSTAWTWETPAIWEKAERNIKSAPSFYGTDSGAVRREAERLAGCYNGWANHLSQEDVDALVAGDRLTDFTYEWYEEDGQRKRRLRDPMPEITAAQVNEWSLTYFGHDSINNHIVIKARCEREGVPYVCATCDGHGSIEVWKGQRELSEAWESVEPPVGEGWQMWETTSEGSPISPVFATGEELAEWLAANGASWFGGETATLEQWRGVVLGGDMATLEIAPGVIML